MADGSQGSASPDDSGAHAPRAGAVVCHLAVGPRLGVIGDDAGTGTGPSHHRTPSTSSGGRRPSGRAGPLPWSSSRPGVPPRPWRDAAGRVEGSGPRVTDDSRHRPGQLELEGGPSVRLGTMRDQPVPQQLPELPPFSRGQALPGNSPDCNADEAVWGWVREEATGNLCLGSKALAQQKVGNFLSGLASRSGEVKRRCRTVLQSRAEALLRDSQPDSGHTPNTHPTLALV